MAPEKPYTCHAWADTCCESVFFFANVFVWAGIENCSVLAIDSSMYLTVDVEVHSRWMHHPCVIKQNLYNSFHIKTNNEQYCCLQEPSASATLKVSQNSVHSSMTVSVTACDYQEIQCWGSLTAHSLYCNLCSGAQKNAPFRETTSQLLLCWHRVSWRGEQSSSQLSEVSRPFVFRTSLGTDGRQNEGEATSEAGYSSVPVVSPPHPTPLRPPPQLRQRFRGLVSVGLLYGL